MPPTPSPLDVEDVRGRVDRSLATFIADRGMILVAISEDLVAIERNIADFVKTGKRLRPAFCWWGWRASAGADSDAAIRAATSLELLHACALIHDDVMDGSDTRRGLPAAHRRFASLHIEQGWHGNPDTFGTAAAILLGDVCLAWADEMFFSSGLTADALLRAKPTLDIMRTELMSGQYLDVVEQARASASMDRALTVARYKSAKYTIERPLHLGAALAGAPAELITAFTNYGLPLGEAFQVRDDILGVFGDPEMTGKPAGDDLRDGKRTYLIAAAFDQATPAQSRLMTAGLGRPDLSMEDVDEVRDVIIQTGALTRAEQLIARRTEEALVALADVELAEPAAGVLADLAIAATTRHG